MPQGIQHGAHDAGSIQPFASAVLEQVCQLLGLEGGGLCANRVNCWAASQVEGRVHVLAATADEAQGLLAASPVDVALVDFHLHDRLDGLGVIDALRVQAGGELPAALLTGDGSDAVKQAARARGCVVLTKPVKPASLRAFLAARRQGVQA